MNEKELLLLERYLTSINFNIPTRAILELKSAVNTWMQNCDCGAIVYGRPRIGKTRAIIYITKELKKKYGDELPIYILNVTDHIASQKLFYTELMKTIGAPEINRGTLTMLKDRLLNTLAVAAMDTIYKKVILFMDEAYLLHEKDYIWLMDIYNNLNLLDIQLTVFMFGTYELKQVKTSLCAAKKLQIVGRFMVEEFKFEGVSSIKDTFVCLLSLDKPLADYYADSIVLTKVFFPEAYKDGKQLAKCDTLLWNAFDNVINTHSINEKDIPMKYLMAAIIFCLKKYGISGKGIYFPDQDAWNDAVANSGYLKSIVSSL